MLCAQEAAPPARDREKEREAYKYFDEAVITVKARPRPRGRQRHAQKARRSAADPRLLRFRAQSGAGGDGEPLGSGKPKTVRNFKYQPGRQQRKFIDLPAAMPADGGAGGDVLLYVVRARADAVPLLTCHALTQLRARLAGPGV